LSGGGTTTLALRRKSSSTGRPDTSAQVRVFILCTVGSKDFWRVLPRIVTCVYRDPPRADDPAGFTAPDEGGLAVNVRSRLFPMLAAKSWVDGLRRP
jgi:hypothetical protein